MCDTRDPSWKCRPDCPKCNPEHFLAESCVMKEEVREEEYYLLSVDHTQSGGELCCWWKADQRGYTLRLERAGRYGAEYIRKHGLDYGIRNNLIHAIPCSVADEHASRVVHRDHWFKLLEKKVVFDLDNSDEQVEVSHEEG